MEEMVQIYQRDQCKNLDIAGNLVYETNVIEGQELARW